MQPDARGSLEDMLEAISHIEDDTDGLDYDWFSQDRQVRQLVQWNFTVIGEAAHRLRKRHPGIADQIQSLHQIIGFRNTIIHGYDRIDYPTVWKVVEEWVSILKGDIEAILPLDEHGGS